MIWREKRLLLITVGVLLAINAIFFFTYRVRFAQRVSALDTVRVEAEKDLQRARQERLVAERALRSHGDVVRTIQTIYNEWWATPEDRLTPLILEMRDLATRSNLIPRAIFYDQSEAERGLGTESLAISFSVQGSYSQVRRLINLIEISSQFVIIDEISLSGQTAADSALRLNIRLRTLFRQTAPSPVTSRS